MSRSLRWCLFLFLVTSGHVHGSRRLSVPVGRSAFIQPDDVITESLPGNHRNVTSCVVKVTADHDVATLLRVGSVTPTVHGILTTTTTTKKLKSPHL